MRLLRGVVAVSLTFNLLLAALFWLAPRPPKPGNLPHKTPASLSSPARIVESSATNSLKLAGSPRLLDWQMIESQDYQDYIANLRKVGCPEKTIRDVIIADVNELYRQRYREIFPSTNRIEYWKPGNPMANLYDEKKIAKEHELRQEKSDLLRKLLGSDYDDEQDVSTIQMDGFNERLLNFLTPDKRTAMKELEDKFTVKLMKTYKDTWRGNDGPADAVKAEKDDAMLEIISPEEKLEYDLRRSDAAMFLRVGLGQFEVSEEEFRAMFQCLKEFLASADKPAFGVIIRGQPDPRPEMGTVRSTFQAKLKQSLGEERFRQLIQQTGWSLKTEEPQ